MSSPKCNSIHSAARSDGQTRTSDAGSPPCSLLGFSCASITRYVARGSACFSKRRASCQATSAGSASRASSTGVPSSISDRRRCLGWRRPDATRPARRRASRQMTWTTEGYSIARTRLHSGPVSRAPLLTRWRRSREDRAEMDPDPETNAIRQRLNEREIPPECPACGHLEGRFSYTWLRRSGPSGIPVSGVAPETRTLMVRCDHCGCLRLFDADVLGL